ncbi:TetR/AcrR family transcriptional regulator [Microbacterium rhizomatis]|uniref:TetR/AcrR family transcriptional regulator n=1 Tax=Microbacterium rhizomatis TaxID=1631477 RepID=A0A5J5IXB1_9MICO|nr:TetR/AcrR family transcriptional regulator [Microbacterium rhizomatis]KAA9105864.1 TetR/AcrR family transcriptional regulator [Microbacterium rhizomatis]
MPRIGARTLSEHNARTWDALGRAFDLLLATRAFDEITFGEIAAEAGIARNTIYNYAPDKVALLLAVTTRASEELQAAVHAVSDQPDMSASRKLHDVIGLLLSSFARDAHRAFVLYQYASKRSDRSNPVTLPLVQIQERIAQVLSEGMEAGEFRADLAPATDVVLLSGLVEAGVQMVVHDPSQINSAIDRTSALVLAAVTR